MKKSTVRLMSALLCMVMILTMLPLRAEAATPVISQKSLTIGIGTKATLKVKNTTKTPQWSSSKKSVATVNSKGVVTAKKFGYATITAKIGSKSYKCKVYVSGNPTLELSAMTLTKGKSRNITLFGATAKSFSSSNPKVVKITSKKGNACTVKALKKGTATITVKDKEGRKYQCNVTVNGNSGGNSSDVQFSGSVTLPNSGISIKTPDRYNNSSDVLAYSEIYDNFAAVTAWIEKSTNMNIAGLVNNSGYAADMYWLGGNGDSDFSLTANTNGQYTLIIGGHFAPGYYAKVNGVDVTSYNQDALICILSCISSTPMSVYNGIYDICYGETEYNAETWYTYGDCKVKYSSHGGLTEQAISLTFTIKKK